MVFESPVSMLAIVGLVLISSIVAYSIIFDFLFSTSFEVVLLLVVSLSLLMYKGTGY
jgi:hypothetical protein